MATNLITTAECKEVVRLLRQADSRIEGGFSAGVIKAFGLDGSLVFQAIAKGRRGPWIARFIDTPTAKWQTNEPKPRGTDGRA